MRRAIDETDRRRVTQAEYNQEHGVVPRSIIKSVDEIRFSTAVADVRERQSSVRERIASYEDLTPDELVEVLEREMREAAEGLDFERAARRRDELFEVKAKLESRRTDRGAARSRLSALRAAEPGHG